MFSFSLPVIRRNVKGNRRGWVLGPHCGRALVGRAIIYCKNPAAGLDVFGFSGYNNKVLGAMP